MRPSSCKIFLERLIRIPSSFVSEAMRTGKVEKMAMEAMCAHVRKDPRRLRPRKREKKKKQVRPPLTEIMKIRKPPFRFYVKMISALWKFQNFAGTQILREINFGDFKSPENACFVHFRGSEFG